MKQAYEVVRVAGDSAEFPFEVRLNGRRLSSASNLAEADFIIGSHMANTPMPSGNDYWRDAEERRRESEEWAREEFQ